LENARASKKGAIMQEQAQASTRTRILDTAERLFAVHGFQHTTIKQLADNAKVNLAAVNYHFGSKMGLIKELIESRMGPTNAEQVRRMNKVRQSAQNEGRPPVVRDVVYAFIVPIFEAKQSFPGNRSSFKGLEGRVFWESNAKIREIFINQFVVPFRIFFETMGLALPELPAEVLLWRIHFAIGAISQCMRLCSINFSTPKNLTPTIDPESTLDWLVDFATAGLLGGGPEMEHTIQAKTPIQTHESNSAQQGRG
jgi:AcrR family transcriptional regulator